MSNPLWRRYVRQLFSMLNPRTPGANALRLAGARPFAYARLEELESRLAPASFAVNSQLQITNLNSEPGALATGAAPAPHAVVFFESSVANYQVLSQGLSVGTDAVVLDSSGDGFKEMAAFLAGRHGLTSIGVVAHGAPGLVALGTGTLDLKSLSGYTSDLAAVGSALGTGGELDLWSCDVATGANGETLVDDISVATGAGVAAADHPVGAPTLGGNWLLDIRAAGARGEVPFDAAAIGAFHQVLGTWSAAASMSTDRSAQTATLLQNGMVLVVGGLGGGDSAELYNPISNTWSSAGSMATARYDQTATLLDNGKVLVAGGNGSGGPLSSAELYDPVSNTWSSAGTMASARWLFTATLLQNGMVLVAGGKASPALASAELYDPASNTWSSAGSMAAGRLSQTATLLSNGQVLVAGGLNGNLTTLSSAELYDPVSNTWSSSGSMAQDRSSAQAVLLSNGMVLVAGGDSIGSAELYDPASNTWSSAGSMATARANATATLLGNGQVLVAGGGSIGDYSSSAELYDPVSNTWSSAGSMSDERWKAAATLLNDGQVLVTGGEDATGSVASADLYDPGPGVPDPAMSTISVTPANVKIGGTATVTFTTVDELGNPVTVGGAPFTFGLGAGTGSGTFSNQTDNNNGTYTATFTATTPGTVTITGTLAGVPITSPLPTIMITGPTTHFQVTAPVMATLGTPVSFTVTALDQNNNRTNSGYTGTVHFTSTDGAATFGTNNVTLNNGTGTFNATFNTPGAQTISANDTTSLGIIGTSNQVAVSSVATQFAVSAPATATAGTPFLATVLAEDTGGHIVSGYSGTVAITTSGGNPLLPPNVTLTNGVGAFLLTMTKTGSATITATDTVTSTITGTSGTITINPGAVSYFTVSGPTTANTGTATPFTVTAYDSSGNVATVYTGKIHFTSSDFNATLPSNAALTNGTGMFNVIFKTAGNQTVTATDTVAGNPSITGTTTIKASGLIVTNFTQTPTGFVVTFNQAFIADDIAEYGAASLVQPVTLVGAKNSNINGTLLFDPTSPTTLAFNATASTLLTFTSISGTAEQVLPDDSYTVTLVSGSAGSNGFQDALSGLDGAGDGGHANYVTTFTTTYQAAGTPELGIPDFARGPSGATPQAISVPNDTGKGGIPITLYNANKVTDATFTLTYDPTLLDITGAGTADSTDATGSSFTIMGTTANTVTLKFHDATALSGTVVLGDVLANVPNSASTLYKNKELLQIGAATVNGATTVLGADSVHVNAYFGDVNGDGVINSGDTAIVTVVASTNPGSSTGFTGFPAYSLLDPIIVGDLAGNGAVDSASITILNNFNVGLYTAARQVPIPPVLTGLVSPNVVQAAVSVVGTTPKLTSLALPSDAANSAADSEQTALIDHVFAQFAKNHKQHRRAGGVSPLILVRRRVS